MTAPGDLVRYDRALRKVERVEPAEGDDLSTVITCAPPCGPMSHVRVPNRTQVYVLRICVDGQPCVDAQAPAITYFQGEWPMSRWDIATVDMDQDATTAAVQLAAILTRNGIPARGTYSARLEPGDGSEPWIMNDAHEFVQRAADCLARFGHRPFTIVELAAARDAVIAAVGPPPRPTA